jgi:short-subunit dehydrogenase
MGTALITGASSGLGVEFAKLFAGDSHSLVLVARRKELLERLRGELGNGNVRVEVIDMDLGQPGAGSRLAERVKALGWNIEFLVNNAGFGSTGSFQSLPLEKELQMIDLNIRTLVELTHLFLPAMISAGHGRILNVGSTAGFQPGPYMSTYYASKAFVNSFSEALHEELKGTGVTCTVLTPGATATGFSKASGNDKSRLFTKGSVADSAAVARAGYKAMQAGRALALPGLQNKLLLQSLRVSPRFLTRKIASFVNR